MATAAGRRPLTKARNQVRELFDKMCEGRE